MSLDIDFGFKQDLNNIRRKLNATERQVIPLAASRALNRTRDNARTRLVRYLQKHFGMNNQKSIRRRLLRKFSRGATKSRLTSMFSYGTYLMAIGDFLPSTQTGSGVVVSGNKSYSFPGAFIATMPNPEKEYTGPFERWGGKVRVISKRTGKSRRTQRIRKPTIDITRPVDVLGKRAVSLAARHTWPKRIDYEVRTALDKLWKAGP